MSETPTLCGECLGDLQHVKMMRQPMGEQCKMCTRPFTAFRWSNSKEARQLKKTIFCGTCAKARNCCQSCMVDIDFGIPLDIRDAALKVAGVDNPYQPGTSSRNAEVKAIAGDKLEKVVLKLAPQSKDDKRAKAEAILKALSSKYKGGQARPKQKALESTTKELNKIITKLPFGGTLATPSDPEVKSFFVFGFSENTPQYVIASFFEAHGALTLIKIVHQARCGYVTFQKRSAAESCAQALKNADLSKSDTTACLVLLDQRELVRVAWGEPQLLGLSKEEQSKLALVVQKAMKHLAEKEKGPRKNQSRPPLAGDQSKKTYKSLARDIEL